MFGTIRRHQTWLWAIIITLTIISFVIYFGPSGKVNRNADRRAADHGSINGEKITDEDYRNAYLEVQLQYFFNNGSWLSDAQAASYEPERQTYFRLLVIKKQEEMGIRVSSDLAGKFGTDMIRNNLHIDQPQLFIDRVLQPHGLTVADLDRYLRHELGIQEMIATVGVSGKLVTSEEAKGLYIRENEEMATEAVFFSASNYLSSVTAPADAVGKYFTNQLSMYRIPERLQVKWVKFPLSNYVASIEKQMTNLNEIVEANFSRNSSNYLKNAKSPEEAKAKFRQDILDDKAMPEAIKEARIFASKFFDLEPKRPENLEMVAKSNGLPVQISEPFDRDHPPKDLDVTPDFTRIAFRLTPEEPFAQPIVGRDGVYVIAFHKKLPSEIPTYDSVRDKVTFDYKYSQAMALARKAGMEFDEKATNGLAQGKTFDAICAEAKVKPVTVPPFSVKTTELPEVEPHVQFRQYREIAFSTQPGHLSGFRPTLDGGVEAFVKSKIAPDENKMKSELPAFVARVRRSRQHEAFGAWFQNEARKSLADIPYFREKEQEQMRSRPVRS